MKKKLLLWSVIAFFCTAGYAQESAVSDEDDYPRIITRDSVFYYASLVNDYFMRTYPDPTADSFVGGKKRNSRIWTRGVYYEGLMAMYRQRQVGAWYEYTREWGDFHKWISNDTSAPSNADFHCCGMAYLDMYMLEPTDTIRKTHIKNHIDTLMYKRQTINDWWWVDAIHMAMPIYAQLGAIEQDERYFEYMYNMYMYTRDKQGGSKKGGGSPLFNEQDGLWYRDYQADPPYTDKVEKDKPCYWSRGNGWVYTALARVLYYAPDTLCHRQQYIDDFIAMSKALAECQREDGFWSVSLAAPTNYGSPESEGPETSGTALFVAGMAYGVHTGLLDSATYMPHVRSGWTALCLKAVDEDGFLHYVQGTGSKPEDAQPIVYATVPDFEDFGVGCFLLAAAEVYQLGDVDTETDNTGSGDSEENSGDSDDGEESSTGSGDSEESSGDSDDGEESSTGSGDREESSGDSGDGEESSTGSGDREESSGDSGDGEESSGDSGDREESSGDSGDGEESSTGSLNAERRIVGTEIYSASGIAQSQPVQGINIVKTLYSDGSIDVKKIFIK